MIVAEPQRFRRSGEKGSGQKGEKHLLLATPSAIRLIGISAIPVSFDLRGLKK
jgi:hypothetical protein